MKYMRHAVHLKPERDFEAGDLISNKDLIIKTGLELSFGVWLNITVMS